MKKLGLINYEGDCLSAQMTSDGILIVDQYGEKVEMLSPTDLMNFLDGKINIVDSEGKSWNYPDQSKGAKQSHLKIYQFISNLDV